MFRLSLLVLNSILCSTILFLFNSIDVMLYSIAGSLQDFCRSIINCIDKFVFTFLSKTDQELWKL